MMSTPGAHPATGGQLSLDRSCATRRAPVRHAPSPFRTREPRQTFAPMPLLSVAIAVGLMLVLVAVVKLDAFLALLLTAFAVGLLNGMDLIAVLQSDLKGLGATLGGVALVLVFGAMLGALLDTSGAARVITQRLVATFGRRGVQVAMALTGFL